MSKPTYFISDVHLSDPSTRRYALILTFLDTIATDARAIYLLGDIFDFWIGYRSTVFAEYLPVLNRFKALSDSGVSIFFIPGNHDPELGPALTQFGIIEVAQPSMIQLGKCNIWLEHGDRWENKPVGALACKMVRSHPFRAIARAIPSQFAWRLAKKYGEHGRDNYDRPLHPTLYEDFVPSCARQGADAIVIGHFHRAVHYEKVIEGKLIKFFVLGDWLAQNTYLKWDNGFSLLRFKGPEDKSLLLPLGDHGPELP